jgi:hypothetical protein
MLSKDQKYKYLCLPKLLFSFHFFTVLRPAQEYFTYSETSLNRTLRKPVLPEYRQIFSVPAEQFFAKEVSQNWPSL